MRHCRFSRSSSFGTSQPLCQRARESSRDRARTQCPNVMASNQQPAAFRGQPIGPYRAIWIRLSEPRAQATRLGGRHRPLCRHAQSAVAARPRSACLGATPRWIAPAHLPCMQENCSCSVQFFGGRSWRAPAIATTARGGAAHPLRDSSADDRIVHPMTRALARLRAPLRRPVWQIAQTHSLARLSAVVASYLHEGAPFLGGVSLQTPPLAKSPVGGGIGTECGLRSSTVDQLQAR